MNNKMLHMAAMVLMWVGGVNWGLVGLLQMNLVEAILGTGMLTNVVYILVGLSTVMAIMTHMGTCTVCMKKK